MSFATMIQVKDRDGVMRYQRGVSGMMSIEGAKKFYAKDSRITSIKVIDKDGKVVFEGSPSASGGRRTRRSKRIIKRRYTKRR
jgi:hypothetical protein